MLMRGFYPDRYHAYRLDSNDWRHYITDRQVLRTSRIDREYGIVLHDKLLFESIVGDWANVPTTIVFLRDGKPLWFRNPSEGESSLRDLIRHHGAVFYKPKDRLCGQGAGLLEFKDGSYAHNGKTVVNDSVDWRLLGSGDIMICEYVQQGSFTKKFYPRTVNTLRMFTMLDPTDRQPFVATAAFRIGSSSSFPVDNVSADAVYCNIDLATGRLGQGVEGFFKDRPYQRIARHPETGATFEGETVPNWVDVCEEINSLAARLHLVPYIAWDVALLDDGIAVIEGNRWGDLSWFQVDRPLLVDGRIRRFLRYHDVL